jgi:hypothetical protein
MMNDNVIELPVTSIAIEATTIKIPYDELMDCFVDFINANYVGVNEEVIDVDLGLEVDDAGLTTIDVVMEITQ